MISKRIRDKYYRQYYGHSDDAYYELCSEADGFAANYSNWLQRHDADSLRAMCYVCCWDVLYGTRQGQYPYQPSVMWESEAQANDMAEKLHHLIGRKDEEVNRWIFGALENWVDLRRLIFADELSAIRDCKDLSDWEALLGSGHVLYPEHIYAIRGNIAILTDALDANLLDALSRYPHSDVIPVCEIKSRLKATPNGIKYWLAPLIAKDERRRIIVDGLLNGIAPVDDGMISQGAVSKEAWACVMCDEGIPAILVGNKEPMMMSADECGRFLNRFESLTCVRLGVPRLEQLSGRLSEGLRYLWIDGASESMAIGRVVNRAILTRASRPAGMYAGLIPVVLR